MTASTKQLDVRRAAVEEKLIMRHLMQLYNYDFTEFDDSDVDDYGLYGYDYLDHCWVEKSRHPYLVRVAGKLAGFAIVKINTRKDGTTYTFMSEFFIMKKFRGQGIGEAVACQLFDRYPGDWEVAEIPQNFPAQAFWRKIIGRYTEGQFTEEELPREVVQIFQSRTPVVVE